MACRISSEGAWKRFIHENQAVAYKLRQHVHGCMCLRRYVRHLISSCLGMIVG